MCSIAKLMKDWQFTGPNGVTTAVELPHTWNARDGQDGGNDYWRGCCTYCTRFAAPVYDPAQQQVWLQFEGVNASAAVLLNGQKLCTHDGGHSTFRAEVTELLQAENQLTVRVDNSVNDRVYPQKADFTFYGGIYRDVSLLVVNKNHIALGHFGDTGVKITSALQENSADIRVETLVEGSGYGAYYATADMPIPIGCRLFRLRDLPQRQVYPRHHGHPVQSGGQAGVQPVRHHGGHCGQLCGPAEPAHPV